MSAASYFISGKGVKMFFNGNVYQNPDSAAIEEGQRLAKVFKNVKVVKITAIRTQTIFKAPTVKELRLQRLNNNLTVCFGHH